MCHKKTVLVIAFGFGIAASVFAGDPTDWKDFTPKDKKFTIKFPSPPTLKKGDKEDSSDSVECAANGKRYLVTWQILESHSDAFVKGYKEGLTKIATQVQEKEVTHDGHKGSDLTFKIVTINWRCRVMVINKAFYSLNVVGDSLESLKDDDAEFFFRSFKQTMEKSK